MDAAIGENGVYPVHHGRNESFDEGGCGYARCARDQLSEGKLPGAVDGNEEGELAPGGLYRADVDVKEADRIRLERVLGGLVAISLGQA